MLTNEELKQTIQLCINELSNDRKNLIQEAKSISNCHFVGVYSIWITETIRCFMTLDDVDDLCVFDNSKPHQNNERFLLHNHRYDISSVPIFGHQENIIYEEVEGEVNDKTDAEDIHLYKKYKFYSAILNNGNQVGHKFIGTVLLKKTKYSMNEPWFMYKNEIHRICWKGRIMALIIEHRNPSHINKEATDAYLVADQETIPCDEHNLYQPIRKEVFMQLRETLIKEMNQYLKK